MCRRTFLSLLPFAFLAVSVFATVDLAPSVTETVEDGFTYQQLTFAGKNAKVTFSPPTGWTFRGGGGRLQLMPPNRNFAEGVIEITPLPEPRPLDEQAIAAFKEQVIATLPGGSQGVAVDFEAENTLMPEGQPSYEIMVTYQQLGKTFRRSVLLVNRPTDRLVFRFSALASDFDALSTPFRRSIMTWRTVDPKVDAPAAAAPGPAAAPLAQP